MTLPRYHSSLSGFAFVPSSVSNVLRFILSDGTIYQYDCDVCYIDININYFYFLFFFIIY
jgi:hypothetical protein